MPEFRLSEAAAAKLRVILCESRSNSGGIKPAFTTPVSSRPLSFFRFSPALPCVCIISFRLPPLPLRVPHQSFSPSKKTTSSYAIYSTWLKISPKTCFDRLARQALEFGCTHTSGGITFTLYFVLAPLFVGELDNFHVNTEKKAVVRFFWISDITGQPPTLRRAKWEQLFMYTLTY